MIIIVFILNGTIILIEAFASQNGKLVFCIEKVSCTHALYFVFYEARLKVIL